MLRRQAHVDPGRSPVDPRLGLGVVQPAQHRLVEQRDEIGLGQAHQRTRAEHGHGGVAPVVRNQRLFAEAVARAQFGQLDTLAAALGDPGHQGPALLDRVEIVADIALRNHDLAGAYRHRLHAHEHHLDVGRRNPVEGLGLQNAGHPVGVAARGVLVEFLHLVSAGLVPGQHDVERVAVDPENRAFGRGRRAGHPRLGVGQWMARLAGRGLDDARVGVAAADLDPSGDQVDVLVVRFAYAEQFAIGRYPAQLDLFAQVGEVVGIERGGRRQARQDLDQVGAGAGAGTGH